MLVLANNFQEHVEDGWMVGKLHDYYVNLNYSSVLLRKMSGVAEVRLL